MKQKDVTIVTVVTRDAQEFGKEDLDVVTEVRNVEVSDYSASAASRLSGSDASRVTTVTRHDPRTLLSTSTFTHLQRI